MRTLYDFILSIYNTLIGLSALLGNPKAKLWIQGRKNWEEKIFKAVAKAGKNRIWFHCASLGEFEQGRPLIEKLKANDPSVFIVLSFFSPSGYELRKNYPLADLVCYLPVDTKSNAKKFISIIAPTCIVFIKYEFWYHYFKEAKQKKIPLYIVSVIFRPTQIFFNWYGTFYRNILKNVTHFFVQDSNSAKLLSGIKLNNVTITGDTRFDRVYSITLEKKQIPLLEKFKGDKSLFIAGSTWMEDEKIFLPSINLLKLNNYKFVIAPHEVNENRIKEIIFNVSKLFSPSEIVCYSSCSKPEEANVLIIDNIGILSSAYRYGNIAWIGGGFGKGIHNILEAAVFGMPVIFGPEYKKFNEAEELISLGGAFTVKNTNQLTKVLEELVNNEQKLNECALISSDYVKSKVGATEKIISKLNDSINFKID